MVQDFHVVRCFRCQSFQVQQVKKAKKWSCKLCGEKQSLLKEFGRGSGADCRRHVQKLNAMRGAMMEEQEASTWLSCEQVEEEEEPTGDQVRPDQVSRWSKYLDTPEEEEEEESEEDSWVGRDRLHGNTTISRKRRRTEEPAEGTRDNGSVPAKQNLPAVTSSAATCGSDSRWGHFLSANGQGVEPSVSGWSQPAGAAATQPQSDVIRPRLQLPVSSMFESGEEFNFDEFLTY